MGHEAVEQPVVSVLMPTHNRASLIEASVASVLGQSFDALELIVIDDRSTDATLALLAEIDDARLRVIRSESPGIGAALNAGLAIARGSYVARNDSDDLWSKDLLATLLPILQADDGIGFVYAPAQIIDSDGQPTGELRGRRPPDPEDPLRCLVWSDYTCSITTVYRTERVRALAGWDTGLGTSEDWDLALRVATGARIAFVDRALASVRVHAGNFTGSSGANLEERLALRVRVLDKFFAAPLPPQIAALREAAYRNVSVGAGIQFWLAGRRALARVEFAKVMPAGQRVAGAIRILTVALAWVSSRYLGRCVAVAEPLFDRLRRTRLDRIARRAVRSV